MSPLPRSGLPSQPQPGAVPDLPGGLPVRPLQPTPDGVGLAPWWWLGCHGGAGCSTLANVVRRGGNAGRYWPVPPAGERCQVVLIARTHAGGLRAAQVAARQWASGSLPPDVQLIGLVAVADAPGRLPRPLRELLALVSGGLPRVWQLPWVEALRRGDPPGQVRLPAAYAQLATDLNHITDHHRTGGSS
ncbi:DUF6668 family protein [Nonomuraea typhae]|uniref:DUF6668 family protein n=1 Tax=Nonomuraea typhae TaxID=2603600 RepID=UPI0012F96382|nr:DUF6668 family protein [Nonomuraea typhae]